MKKKKLSKKLDLGKKQISKLGNVKGGVQIRSHITCTIGGGNCGITEDLFNCTWHSELYTACECPPSWGIVCPIRSVNICDA